MVRNPGAAESSSSGAGSLVRLLPRCGSELESSEDLAEVKDLLPRRILRWLLARGISSAPHGPLVGLLLAEQLTSPRGREWPRPKLPCSFLKRFTYLFFRERGREGEREGEKRQCVVAFRTPPTRDMSHNSGMCPDWESNQ